MACRMIICAFLLEMIQRFMKPSKNKEENVDKLVINKT